MEILRQIPYGYSRHDSKILSLYMRFNITSGGIVGIERIGRGKLEFRSSKRLSVFRFRFSVLAVSLDLSTVASSFAESYGGHVSEGGCRRS
jgi:hypothetical protein